MSLANDYANMALIESLREDLAKAQAQNAALVKNLEKARWNGIDEAYGDLAEMSPSSALQAIDRWRTKQEEKP